MKSLKRMHPLILAAIVFGLALGAGLALAKPGRATGGGKASPPGQSNCAECHEDMAAPGKGKGGSVHPPVADGDCLSCPKPHAGTGALLANAAPGASGAVAPAGP